MLSQSNFNEIEIQDQLSKLLKQNQDSFIYKENLIAFLKSQDKSIRLAILNMQGPNYYGLTYFSKCLENGSHAPIAESVKTIRSIIDLLDEQDKSKFILHHSFTIREFMDFALEHQEQTIRDGSIIKVNQEEILNDLCQIFIDHLSEKQLTEYCNDKTMGGKTIFEVLFDDANKSGNPKLVEIIAKLDQKQALQYDKKIDKEIYREMNALLKNSFYDTKSEEFISFLKELEKHRRLSYLMQRNIDESGEENYFKSFMKWGSSNLEIVTSRLSYLNTVLNLLDRNEQNILVKSLLPLFDDLMDIILNPGINFDGIKQINNEDQVKFAKELTTIFKINLSQKELQDYFGEVLDQDLDSKYKTTYDYLFRNAKRSKNEALLQVINDFNPGLAGPKKFSMFANTSPAQKISAEDLDQVEVSNYRRGERRMQR